MIITHRREKLIQAIIFFSKETKWCGKTKLFKLLYLLDFEHFKQTGRSVTGMDYYAWEMGPVPVALAEEWENFKPDLKNQVNIKYEVLDYETYIRQTLVAKVDFDDTFFTRRERRLMSEIADRYRDHYASDMVDVTHAENGAWEKAWDNGKGYNQRIDYLLAVGDVQEKQYVMRAAKEYTALLEQVGVK
ncbi:XRE family [Candidatus Thiomargarita nelsonii]|uniref:XRE family n=1 Tax=Candidatus Thiomargarita nelsonii TaxID=1003181 RepID=A0A176S5V9_9GAMM|nr:XRE family [Candidatus Thiomargarita nelsonii]